MSCLYFFFLYQDGKYVPNTIRHVQIVNEYVIQQIAKMQKFEFRHVQHLLDDFVANDFIRLMHEFGHAGMYIFDILTVGDCRRCRRRRRCRCRCRCVVLFFLVLIFVFLGFLFLFLFGTRIV
jgi:hypothetical protein